MALASRYLNTTEKKHTEKKRVSLPDRDIDKKKMEVKNWQ